MGYRSRIKSCIYSEDATLFDAFIASQKLVGCQVFNPSSDDNNSGFAESLEYIDKQYTYALDKTTQIIKILDLTGDDWKWYDDYADVKSWHKLLDLAEQAGLNWEFCRVGEEDGDVDYQSGGDNVENFLSTYTSINCDYGD